MFNVLQKKALVLLTENASALLTAGGVVGTVTTAVLTGRAAAQSVRKLHDRDMEEASKPLSERKEITRKDNIMHVWPYFIPPVIAGGATIGSIVMASRISAQRAAALAAAYAVSEKQLKEYRGKVEEKLGVKKATEVQDSIQQDRVNTNPPTDKMVIVGNGEVLCYDKYSDRYFKSSVEYIRRAEQVVQREIMNRNECELQLFYDELDIKPTEVSKTVGWNLDHPCNVTISATMSNENTPVIAIDFVDAPIWNYGVEYK